MATFANEAAYKTAIQSLTDTLHAVAAGNPEVRIAQSKLGELVASVRNANGWNASAELTPSA